MSALAAQIEAFLLSSRRWVSADELCERFLVNEREFRATAGRPGLCSAFAISGNSGFLHVACASDEEFAGFYERVRRHGIGELVRVRRLRRRRMELRAPRVVPPAMTIGGQFLLLQDGEVARG